MQWDACCDEFENDSIGSAISFELFYHSLKKAIKASKKHDGDPLYSNRLFVQLSA